MTKANKHPYDPHCDCHVCKGLAPCISNCGRMRSASGVTGLCGVCLRASNVSYKTLKKARESTPTGVASDRIAGCMTTVLADTDEKAADFLELMKRGVELCRRTRATR